MTIRIYHGGFPGGSMSTAAQAGVATQMQKQQEMAMRLQAAQIAANADMARAGAAVEASRQDSYDQASRNETQAAIAGANLQADADRAVFSEYSQAARDYRQSGLQSAEHDRRFQMEQTAQTERDYRQQEFSRSQRLIESGVPLTFEETQELRGLERSMGVISGELSRGELVPYDANQMRQRLEPRLRELTARQAASAERRRREEQQSFANQVSQHIIDVPDVRTDVVRGPDGQPMRYGQEENVSPFLRGRVIHQGTRRMFINSHNGSLNPVDGDNDTPELRTQQWDAARREMRSEQDAAVAAYRAVVTANRANPNGPQQPLPQLPPWVPRELMANDAGTGETIGGMTGDMLQQTTPFQTELQGRFKQRMQIAGVHMGTFEDSMNPQRNRQPNIPPAQLAGAGPAGAFWNNMQGQGQRPTQQQPAGAQPQEQVTPQMQQAREQIRSLLNESPPAGPVIAQGQPRDVQLASASAMIGRNEVEPIRVVHRAAVDYMNTQSVFNRDSRVTRIAELLRPATQEGRALTEAEHREYIRLIAAIQATDRRRLRPLTERIADNVLAGD